MTKIINTINDDYFVHPNGLGFDFTSKSDISFVMFLGYEPKKNKQIKNILDYWKKRLDYKSKFKVNVIIIGDRREYDHYIANYYGIEGVCENLWDLSYILLNKLYLKGTTKRTVVFADCGGSIPAMLTSIKVPYHSINLTTPYMSVIGSDHSFDTSQYTMWHSRELSIWVYDNSTEYKQFFETIDYYDLYSRNNDAMLTMHWANNIIGTDRLFRDMANNLPKRPNIKIIDHIVPHNIEGHKLAKYLFDTKKYEQLIVDECNVQKARLNVDV